jgi:hypothetical protein
MAPEGSLPYSQMPATCLYPEPTQSSPYPHMTRVYIVIYIVPASDYENSLIILTILIEMYGLA